MGRPAQKGRKLNVSSTEEVVFDLAARQDYLTGFHKRKVQRTKAAQEAAAKRAREEKIEARKEHRAERRAEIENHVKQVNDLLQQARGDGEPESVSGGESEDGEEWSGLEDATVDMVDHEAEYIDEDKYTTVTVEEVDITREGISKMHADDETEAATLRGAADATDAIAKPVKTDKTKTEAASRRKEANQKRKKKKRDFRYESPAERKMNRLKVKAKKSKQAKARKGDE